MLVRYFAVIMFASVIIVGLGGGPVVAQDYPIRPIRVVTSDAGGSSDFVSRIIAQEISGPLGQPVIVDNRSSGVIQGQVVVRAGPNGYTLLVTGPTFWIAPLMDNTPYDPVRDFSPIGSVVSGVNILVVPPSLPVKSVKDLIALAKAKPGELNYASTATGTATHLAAELFKSMAGVKIVRVAYKGTGPAITDLTSGQVQVMFASAPSVMPHVKSGRLRAVAVTSAQPSVVVPDLPTVAASGVPGYEAVTITGMFAPAKTPVAIINRLNQELVRAITKSDVKEKFLGAGLDAAGSSPERFGSMIQADMTKWSKLIKETGISSN